MPDYGHFLFMSDIKEFLKDCYKLKPDDLIMPELHWKYLMRSVYHGKNTLLLGDSGGGKTMSCKSVAKALNREDKFFVFNLGASTDPRSFLIGNTHFEKDKGTFFAESTFIKAIKTENAIILLDEISRCHPDGVNILMSVLDDIQRYVRLDEKDGSETIKVAKGVCFLATANIGGQYTTTRVMDRALMDRFPVKLEMQNLSADEEYGLILKHYPKIDRQIAKAISEICSSTRDSLKKEGSKITNFLSTRSSIEMAGLANDGFTLLEIAETAIYSNFSDDGGLESERTYMKQLIQKYVGNSSGKKLF